VDEAVTSVHNSEVCIVVFRDRIYLTIGTFRVICVLVSHS